MRIVMAGASGFLGTRLRRDLLNGGHDVVQLVRREPSGPDQRRWWPDRGELDPAVLAGADAVINLNGAGVEDRRWTNAYKRVLRSSRIEPTATLATTLAALPAGDRPGTLLNASGIHFYGDRGDDEIDEQSPPGRGFFAEMCQAWEAAAAPAEDAGVRVVKLRTGLTIDRDSAFMKPFLLQFRLFAGGRLGNGRQWMPWVSMRDWLGAATMLLASDIAGPVNMVGPAAVRNSEFTRVLAGLLHRPALLPVPMFALKVAIGEFAGEALASLRARPGVLHGAGFTYADRDVASALAWALQRAR
jgi:uncharacterized protein (TIGR01777 family)